MVVNMKEGILEVLLVSAKGIKKKSYLGRPNYYVVIQCGDQAFKSKTTSGKDKKATWNEKFMFKFSDFDWQNRSHLKLKIMDEKTLSDGNFIGETIVHLGGIISEGNEKGFMELKATPYKVVLDDTYEGEIKIGLKFISNVEMQTKSRDFINEENQPPWSMCKKVFSYLRIPQWRIFHFYKRSIPSMAINKRN